MTIQSLSNSTFRVTDNGITKVVSLEEMIYMLSKPKEKKTEDDTKNSSKEHINKLS